MVAHEVYRQAADALGLSEEERTRLARELSRMNLRVDGPVPPTRTPRSERADPVKLSPAGNGAVPSPRLDLTRLLLRRFADPDGGVRPDVLEGVSRLAGLSPREAELLRAGARIVHGSSGHVEDREAPSTEPGAEGPDTDDLAAGDPGIPFRQNDTDAAVAAARAVMAEDRLLARPAKRILTAQQEVGLAVLLRGGASRIGDEPTDQELAELPATHERRRARDCLVLHNQGLVHALSPRFLDQGLEYEDIAQHGKLGLIRAARKFDARMGHKFSTYATWWIRQSIHRAIADEGSLIRIPVHMHELAQKVARAEREMLARGHSPRAADVAVACDLTVAKVEQIRRLTRRTDSLDRVIGDGVHLGDLLDSRHAIPSPEQSVLDAQSEAEMLAAIALLPDRYTWIVTRRYGLDGSDPATLDAVGKDLNVTRERVRQLEAKVVPLLRLAFADAAGSPSTALRLMLSDPWLKAKGNAVHAITKDFGEREWAEGVSALRAFRQRETPRTERGNPHPGETEGRFAVGKWVAEQVKAGGTGGRALPTHRRLVLESLGVTWQERPATARPQAVRRTVRRVPSVPNVPPSAVMATTAHVPDPKAFGPDPVAAPGTAAPETETPVQLSLTDLTGTPVPAVSAMPPTSTADAENSGVTAPSEPNGPNEQVRGVPEHRYTDLWEEVTRLPIPFERNVRWLAEYAVMALGPQLLETLLGAEEAAAAVAAARGRHLPDRPVVRALDTLATVVDQLRSSGRRPEEFFEAPCSALLDTSPREYLAARPLVRPESRLALGDALKAFRTSTASAGTSSAPARVVTHASALSLAVPVVVPTEPTAGRLPESLDHDGDRLAALRRAHQEELTALRRELAQQLAEVRAAHDESARAAELSAVQYAEVTEHAARIERALSEASANLALAERARSDAEAARAAAEEAYTAAERMRMAAEAAHAEAEYGLGQAERARAATADRAVQAIQELSARLTDARQAQEDTAAALALSEQDHAETRAALAQAERARAATADRAVQAVQQATDRVAQVESDAATRIAELERQLRASHSTPPAPPAPPAPAPRPPHPSAPPTATPQSAAAPPPPSYQPSAAPDPRRWWSRH
ncbi:sigma-70 family RNA polymerase sigma factor [Streptomyces sp. TLI_053]|uniref:sigma-70 family RNA polymerase sigma factor n=1 Tax=Streptomyces sp. TLI_053 TaxID=1855352 RepID=UPI0013520FAB|nr:sigma-70 family RNA polymerase sigma factor [Streptomyces sp. TLI_053]